MSLEEIRNEARKFHDRIRKRNIREYSAAVITCVIMVLEIRFLKLPVTFQVALGLGIAGTLVLLYQMRKRGASRALPTDMAFMSCLEFHRQELERQRDTLETFWIWGLMPLVPFGLVFTFAFYFMPRGGLILSLIVGVFVACFLTFFGKLNQRGARKLQRQIDELRG